MRSLFAKSVVLGTIAGTVVLASSYGFAHAKISATPIRVDNNGNVARWDPCSNLEWRIGSGAQNSFFVSRVRRAMSQINNATGLNFRYSGSSNVQSTESATRNILLINLVQRLSTPNAAGNTHVDFADGQNASLVIIDSTISISKRVTTGGLRYLLMPVLLHELGHAVGLAHVDDSHNIMYPRAITSTKYTQNEVAEFAMYGASAGCHPVIDSANL